MSKRSVELRASRISITLPCPPCMHSMSGSCPREFDPRIRLTANADGFNKRLIYSYSVTAGQIVGEGSQVDWDLSNCTPGIYTASVEVQDDEVLSETIKRNGEYISIPTNDRAGRTVYVRVDVKGLDPSCTTAATSSTKVQP